MSVRELQAANMRHKAKLLRSLVVVKG